MCCITSNDKRRTKINIDWIKEEIWNVVFWLMEFFTIKVVEKEQKRKWFNLGPCLWSFMCVASGFVKGGKVRSNSKNIIVETVHLSKVLTKINENV